MWLDFPPKKGFTDFIDDILIALLSSPHIYVSCKHVVRNGCEYEYEFDSEERVAIKALSIL